MQVPEEGVCVSALDEMNIVIMSSLFKPIMSSLSAPVPAPRFVHCGTVPTAKYHSLMGQYYAIVVVLLRV